MSSHPSIRMRAIVGAAAAAVCLCVTSTAHAANPVHQVTMVLTTPSGSTLGQSATVQAARDEFARMSTYWSDQTGGLVDFQLEKLDWWPGHGTCGGNSGTAGNASQEESGFVPGPQKHLATIVAGCGPAGVSTVTGGITGGGRVYIEGFWDGYWTHEFGHNLGFGHAGYLHCPGATVDGALTADGGPCEARVYGDSMDTMASSDEGFYRGFSTPNLIRRGILPASDYVAVDDGAAVDRTVTIASRDLRAGLRSVQIADPRSDRTYWVEMSSNDGYSAGQFPAGGVKGDYGGTTYRRRYGVRVLRADAPQTTTLLPAPPADGERSMAWPVGSNFVSASGGVDVTVVATTATTATLRVRNHGAPAPAAPTLSATAPASPAADGAPRVIGSAVPTTTVTLYPNASCTGAPVGSGPAAAFGDPGLPVSVPEGTTTVYGTATDVDGATSGCSSTSVVYTRTASPSPTSAGGVQPAGGPGTSAASPTRRSAKLQVLGALMRRGRLRVVAQITGRATGTVSVAYRSSGRTVRLEAPIDGGRIRVSRRLSGRIGARSTGIVTVRYAGNAAVRPDDVRVRAAARAAGLRRTVAEVRDGRLRVAGTIAAGARGAVIVRIEYPDGADVGVAHYRAPVRRGRWSLDAPLPAGAAALGGQVSLRFTGDERAGIRGEQDAKLVQPARR